MRMPQTPPGRRASAGAWFSAARGVARPTAPLGGAHRPRRAQPRPPWASATPPGQAPQRPARSTARADRAGTGRPSSSFTSYRALVPQRTGASDEPVTAALPEGAAPKRGSEGRISVIVSLMPAGAGGPPLHKHDFDEAFYVLDGELTFQVGSGDRRSGGCRTEQGSMAGPRGPAPSHKPGRLSPVPRLDPEDREPRRHPLELFKRRVLVYRHVRPGVRRPPQVRLQNGRAPLGGDAL